MEDLIGDLIATPQPIEVILVSEEGSVLAAAAHAVAEAIGKVPGIVDLNDGMVLAGDALDLVIDQPAAAREGLDAEGIARTVAIHLDGQVATRVQRGPEMLGIRVWTMPRARQITADVGAISLRAADGHLVPLSRIATVTPVSGQPQIRHDDLGRALAVTARIDQRDLGSVVREVSALLAQPGVVPEGVRWRLGGLYEQQQIAFADLGLTIAIAVLLVVVLLVIIFQSFRVALAMTTTTALSLAAVFIGLRLTGTDLNLTALMGLTMVVGIVTEVSIILYSECAERPLGETIAERLIQAGLSRMRPIAMTILAAILALMPLACGVGQGSAMQQPLAIAIISGLLAQFPLALVVLPALLMWLRLR
jgi:multidrug efflux pump subunit AcrB